MQFSLKRILALMMYVAIVAAAFTRPAWLYADVLWALSLLTNVYAATLAVFAPGRQKAAAIGFVLASVGFAVFALANMNFAAQLGHGGFFPIEDFFFVIGIDANSPDPHTILRLRMATAVATMVSGLIGSLLGLMAFRAARRVDDTR